MIKSLTFEVGEERITFSSLHLRLTCCFSFPALFEGMSRLRINRMLDNGLICDDKKLRRWPVMVGCKVDSLIILF